MNNLQVFNSEEFGQIRVVEQNGEPWFVAKDVCEILDISKHRDAVARLDGDERGPVEVDTLGGKQAVTAVNEYGLYSLVLGSRKPEARAFKRWVTHEVIPAIRKTGSYTMLPQDYPSALRALADSEEQRMLAIATKAEIGSRREATAMNTASQQMKRANKLEMELDKAKTYASIKRMTMQYQGLRFKWQELKEVSKLMNLPPIDVFDQNYGKVKAYHKDVWYEVYALDVEMPEG